MTVKEAIKEIIKSEGLDIFNDHKKFMAMLSDFDIADKKELNKFSKSVDKKILKICIDKNLDDDKYKINTIRMKLEDDGFAKETIDFIIEQFAFALGWNYLDSKSESKKEQQKQQTKKNNRQNIFVICIILFVVVLVVFIINSNNKSKDSITYSKTENTNYKQPKKVEDNKNYIEVTLDKNVLEQLGYEIYDENKGTFEQKTYLLKNGQNITYLDIPTTYSYDGNNYKITKIGDVAFAACKLLKSVTIPESVTLIGKGAFQGCFYLKNVNIPDSVIDIEDAAFWSCFSLINVNIPNGVKKIGYGAFSDCYELTNVNIPDTVETIGTDAFKDVPHIEYHGIATGAPWGAKSMN